MLIWGSGRKQVRLRAAGTKPCTNCGTERSFSVLLSYSYAHLYYLFSWITRRAYLQVCDVCSKGQTIAREEAEVGLKEDPIPYLERSGWKIGAGILAALAAFLTLMPFITANAQRPHVGDVYEALLDPRDGDAKNRYGLVRVESISDQSITLVSSREAYPDRKAVHAAFEARRWKETAYLDREHPFQLTPQNLEGFLRSGRVFNIWRED
jgi:hypothetical protein